MAKRRPWGRLLLATIIVTLVTIMGGEAVSAHARPKTSDPADKATVTKAPAQVTIIFTEETSPTKSGGSVTDASGATVSTAFKVDLNDRTKMTIDLKSSLPNGIYTVKWNSFTDEDNGVADGTLTFTIQATGTGTTVAQAATVSPVATTTTAATVTPTTAPAATTAPTVAATATRSALTPAATGTGGGIATTAPATLPKTGTGTAGGSAPSLLWITLAGALLLAAGAVVRLLAARSRNG